MGRWKPRSDRSNGNTVLQSIIFNPPVRRSFMAQLPELGFRGGSGVRVAVIDSGVNRDVHVDREVDFTGYGAYDGIQPQTHGTMVAAVIQHFARNAEIMNVKVTHHRENISWLNVMKGLKYARDNGAHIANLSIGHYNKGKQCMGTCPRCLEVQAYAKHTGMIIVAAAGNEGPDEGTLNCPAVATDVIGVGMVDVYGQQIDRISSRALPGMAKPNLVASGQVTRHSHTLRGTSFAAPVVTGLLAASLPAFEGNVSKMIDVLYTTCKEIDSIPFHHQGHGRLDIKAFVEEVMGHETVDVNSQRQNQN